MDVNTLLKVLEQLLHKIKANRRREMIANVMREEWVFNGQIDQYYTYTNTGMQIKTLFSTY